MRTDILPGSVTLDKYVSDYSWYMWLLVWSPDRICALRLALSRVIHPTSVVLDAGCGALGVLAIMAAKAGAARVIAIDTVNLDLARKLAEENSVADRIDFIQGDLRDTTLPVESFDVMIGMIYKNEIKRDLTQQNLMRELCNKYALDDTTFIPNKVRYSATGFYYPGGDEDASRARVELDQYIENAERYTGITLSASREVIQQVIRRSQNSNAQIGKLYPNRMGYYNRSNLALLTERTLFTEICYNDRSEEYAYPEVCALPVIHPGLFNTVIWQQDLVFDDILLRTWETINLVSPASIVEPGMIVNLCAGRGWEDKVPIGIDGKMSAPVATRQP